jgi:two-component system, chemotaxis family, sensor kinase CheA
MDSFFSKFRNVFLEEAQDLLNSYELDLLQLEKDPGDINRIDSAFRTMHTLKGTSGMYGFAFISELTHKLETIFQAVRERHLGFNKELFELTFSVIDHLRKLLFDESLTDKTLAKEHKDLMEMISIFSSTKSLSIIKAPVHENQTNPAQSLWHILLNTTEAQYFRGISFTNIFRDLANLGTYIISKTEIPAKSGIETWSITLLTTATKEEINEVFLFIEDDCTIVSLSRNIENSYKIKKEEKELSILEIIDSGDFNRKEGKVKENFVPKMTSPELSRISVDSTKLDHLMFLVSELITLNSQMALSLKEKSYNTLSVKIEKLDSLSKQFRNNALELRLVPLRDIVLRFQRLIRDLSKQLDKKIEFSTHGDENEIDKSIIDKLSEPLMHIIRNCIDHGIESPEKRIKLGKSEIGHITLSANHSSGKIFIKVEDDGNGINLDKVKEKAIHLGLLKTTDQISKNELIHFIFEPGFSTAQSLSSVSGRGVGMDIVRKRIQELRGNIIVDSQEGIGTSFIIVLQQSVSIIDSLLFKVEDSFFTLPISDINICSEMGTEELDLRKHTSTLPFGEQLIPFVNMRKILSLGGQYARKIKLIIFKNNERMM